MDIIARCITGAIGVYQRTVSPFMGPHCRFHPTCSQYMIDAVRARGVLPGFGLGLMRLARCNPLFAGGYDPVEEYDGKNAPEADGRR